jgi:hypothetical protein
MAISPDAKYLYFFQGGRIYQYELPGLKLVTSMEVEVPEKLG